MWKRYKDTKPAYGTRVAVLIDGSVFEGSLEMRKLGGRSLVPVELQFIIVPGTGFNYKRVWHWGFDPYWMEIEPLPEQEQPTYTFDQLSEMIDHENNAAIFEELAVVNEMSRVEIQHILDTYPEDTPVHNQALLVMWEYEYFDEHGTYEDVRGDDGSPIDMDLVRPKNEE